MKNKLFNAFGFIVLGILAFTVSPTSAQTTANGPYYANPSWDQTLPSGTRFIVLSNMNSDAVLDRETGLVWQKSPSGTDFWAIASSTACGAAATGGRFGWRLPTVAELTTLFDPAAVAANTNPPLFAGSPFVNVPPAVVGNLTRFWTANPGVGANNHTTVIYGINPINGRLVFGTGTAGDDTLLMEWCVRGGLFSGQVGG